MYVLTILLHHLL